MIGENIFGKRYNIFWTPCIDNYYMGIDKGQYFYGYYKYSFKYYLHAIKNLVLIAVFPHMYRK